MLALEKLEYPSSIRGKGPSRGSMLEMGFMVVFELVRRASSGRSFAMLFLVKPPYKLEPGAIVPLPHSVSTLEFPHCQAISGPVPPMSARCFGGGRGGGAASLMFGMGIGTEGVEGEERELD
jgi:hypothetical protein